MDNKIRSRTKQWSTWYQKTLLYPHLGVALSVARLFAKRLTIAIIPLSSLDSCRCLKALSHKLQLLEDVFADRVCDTCSNCFVSSTASGKHMLCTCNLRVILNSVRPLTSVRWNRYKMLYEEEFVDAQFAQKNWSFWQSQIRYIL